MALSKRTKTFGWALAAIVLLVLAVAWFDGGREQQRLIVEPVAVPETDS